MKFFLTFLSISCLWIPNGVFAQADDAFFIKEIYDHTLTEGKCYDWLTTLSTEMGGRIAGSEANDKAIAYTRQLMEEMKVEETSLQECTVNYWERGKPELVKMLFDDKSIELPALALGNSIGTGPDGITGEVIEVQSLDEVSTLGQEVIEGKIVFYNRPMDPTMVNTFYAYGSAVDQRVWGASVAAEFGAIGTLVRSMTLKLDDEPHTGTLVYKEDQPKIPSIAISTKASELLSNHLKEYQVSAHMFSDCRTVVERPSYNVIGEIKGSEFPEEIIVVGGHLDSWDVAGGAHDDGAGCVHALQVLQTLIDLDYRPKRTIRCVMFSNEENGLAGGKAYAEASNEKGEKHLFALESDAGGFVPRGFSFDADTSVFEMKFKQVYEWLPLLEPYGLYLAKGGSGADINPLKSQMGLLAGLRPDSQRYFDYHHTKVDKIEAVNKRELELGAAAMTSLIYLVDKYGIE